MLKLELENKFVTVDGRKIRYVEGGDGPPLVILPLALVRSGPGPAGVQPTPVYRISVKL